MQTFGSVLLLSVAVLLAVSAQGAAASPFGAKLAAAPETMAVPTSAAKTKEMKKHAVSAHSDMGKRAAGSAPTLGLQAMPGLGAGGDGSTLDENDPAAALTKIIAPEDVPKTNADGTEIEDSGVIGADGKRQGKLADPPDFTFPIVFAVITSIIMVIYFAYSCCFAKEEKRSKSDSYM